MGPDLSKVFEKAARQNDENESSNNELSDAENEEETVASENDLNDEMDENDMGPDLSKVFEKAAKQNDENGSSDAENDSSEEDSNDEMDENDMGPDLSEVFEKAAQENENDSSGEEDDDEENTSEPALISNNVDKEVSKGQAIQKQLQIWDGLLELRITLQKSLTKINQLPQVQFPLNTKIARKSC